MKQFLRHLFVPHESNNHRARVLHHDALFLIIAILFSGFVIIQGAHREYPAVLGDTTAITVQELLNYTNIERESRGLSPLVLNPALTQAAEMKAKDMLGKDYWAHVAPDGTTPWVFIKDAGYEYLYAGENLARGFTTSSDVVEAWMGSPEHRANLLSSNYTDIGFAIENGSLTGTETTLVVQEFGSPYTSNDAITETSGASLPPPSVHNVASSQSAQVVVSGVKIDQPSAFAGASATKEPPILGFSALKQNIAFSLLLLLLVALAIDAIIIERKKIVRVFSHNVDHMLYLLFIFLVGIIIGKGVIL